MRRLHFTWISAAEGKKFQQVIEEITEQTRALGPYRPLREPGRGGAAERLRRSIQMRRGRTSPAPSQELRATARRLLEEGKVKVVIGHGASGPVFITRAEDATDWNGMSTAWPI